MLQLERQDKILEYINQKRSVRNKELSKIFKISMVTIRADIRDLDKRGLIIKVHGGAVSVKDRLNLEIPYQSKNKQHSEEKKLIGALAASMIEENDVIILDSGTTTLEIAKRIKHKNVTVITNDIIIGMTLVSNNKVTLVMTGGEVVPFVYTLYGGETVNFLHRIKANKLFLGCDAFHFERGVSNRTLQEVAVKQAMIAASNMVIAVVDNSKHNKELFAHTCDVASVNMLVTNHISSRDQQQLANAGVEVLSPKQEKITN